MQINGLDLDIVAITAAIACRMNDPGVSHLSSSISSDGLNIWDRIQKALASSLKLLAVVRIPVLR